MAGEEETEESQEQTPSSSMVLFNYNKFRASPGTRPQGQDDVESLNFAVQQGKLLFGQQAATAAGSRGSRSAYAPPTSFFGEALVDEDGYVVRSLYDLDADTAALQMAKFSPAELKIWAIQAKRTDYYGNGDPSGLIMNGRGYSNTDILAMQNFLRTANQTGFVARALLMQMSSWSSITSTGGARVKVTAPEDIRYYLDQAWLSRFGRRPNKSDIDSAISAIQSRERSASAQGESTPSTQVLAKAQAEKTDRSEGASYQLGNAMQLAFKYLGGG